MGLEQVRLALLSRKLGVNTTAVAVTSVFIFATSLTVYGLTLAPSITWKNGGADSGDLVTAAFTGGIPHPPGYPLYTALAQIIIAIPMGSIAYRVNWLSAIAAAITVVILFQVTVALFANWSSWSLGIAGATALFFGFTPLFWSQATFAEVYALNTLFVIATLAAYLGWARAIEKDKTKQTARVYQSIASLGLGFGIAHHLTIIFLVPAGFILLWQRVRAPELIKTFIVAFLIGFLLYLTLSWRAWNYPPINWGDPRTLENWWWLVSGQLYQRYVFGLPVAEYPTRIATWAKFLFDQFGIAGVILGLWGSVELVQKSFRMGFAFGLTFFLYSLYAIGYYSVDSNVYLIPAYLIFALWIACALYQAVVAIQERLTSQSLWLVPFLAAGLYLFPLSNLVGNYAMMDASRDTEAFDYGREIFAAIPNNAMIVTDGDKHIFALWYYRYVVKPDSHVLVVAKGLVPYAWYRDQLRRQNLEWIWADAIETRWDQFLKSIVEKNSRARSIYWTDPDPVFQNTFQFRRIGSIYQVSALIPP